MKLFYLLMIALLFITSCNSKEENPYKNWSPKKFYNEAKLNIENNELEAAIKKLEKLQAVYPASKFSSQAKLDIAYALFKNNEYNRAIGQLNSFIRLYPNNASIDYAYYMRGIISEEKSKSILDDIIIDDAQKNIKGFKDSLVYYTLLIKKFPSSKYSKEAYGKLVVLQNKLSRHELLVAGFYYRKKSYIATINRLQYLIINYPKTASIPIALKLLVQVYDIMQMKQLKQDAQRVLNASYPNYSIDIEKELDL